DLSVCTMVASLAAGAGGGATATGPGAGAPGIATLGKTFGRDRPERMSARSFFEQSPEQKVPWTACWKPFDLAIDIRRSGASSTDTRTRTGHCPWSHTISRAGFPS